MAPVAFQRLRLTGNMRRIAIAGLVLASLAALAAICAGLGYRWEFWSHGPAFTILRWAGYASLAGAAVSLVAALLVLRRRPRRGLLPAAAGLALGLLVAAVPLSYLRAARSVPPIHDISTDMDDPPGFVAILALRANAPNSAVHAGASIAGQQREAYPDIVPIVLPLAPQQAFTKALAATRALGWQVVAAVPEDGRIEATDRTFWFGFRDDVVVRVKPQNGGSVIDLRSVSRVGRSDVGANAKRIRRFAGEINN
jgi:uncharacterized protein (DUF1499 family)